ncbi:MAG: NAD-dependent epimerase/dehydratase family protein [Bacteroidales bacterium]|nr:NAD-dependent epimerase/dehydratase family protein [Bacteroidales bacterium]
MILVTGGTGLIGSHLLWRLHSEGKAIRALYRNYKRVAELSVMSQWYNSDDHDWYKSIEWIEVDMFDEESLREVLTDIELVYHCAATVSFHPSGAEEMIKKNVIITASLVNLCLKQPGIRLCHVSSVAALGRAETDKPIDEKNIWKSSSNNSPYAISKFESEREVWRGFAEGLDGFIVNPSMVIGPGKWGESSTELIEKVYRGLRFYTSGINAYVDVRDVVTLMTRLMDDTVQHARFILAGCNISFRTFFNITANALGVKPPAREAKPWMAEIIWRFEWVRHKITGSTPLVSRAMARTAVNTHFYSSEKIQKRLHHTFIPIEESIGWSASCFLHSNRHKSSNNH